MQNDAQEIIVDEGEEEEVYIIDDDDDFTVEVKKDKVKDKDGNWVVDVEWEKVKDKENKSAAMVLSEAIKNKNYVKLIGDSMIREVCKELNHQSGGVIRGESMPGARIEQIVHEVKTLKDDEKRHLILMTGTNNVQKDDPGSILNEYRQMIASAKKVINRKISVVGIMTRFDATEAVERKRSKLNVRIREMCEDQEVEFLSGELQRRMTSKYGVHLNVRGQRIVGQKLMKHCLYFLG